ncbi:hypothetical protein [Capillimicrobium parvum]|uniref:DUF4142 domain-containing protein n=1 Tax=Capillimicrobium parvum TaxID=2884022 RepID=A0A9E7C276_9ACTN|nr:hypothetical protein [Capillimicrobium parvum]UGS37454.1 hypothetical protein DSM104329_03870 [Capillimicrobium parvum]
MRVSRRLILAAGVAVAAAGGAAAVAATQSGSSSASTTHDPASHAARAHARGGPGGPGRMRGPRLDANARAVVDAIRTAVVARAVTVAGPIVDQAVKDGELTQAQADTARQALADAQAGKRPSADAFALLRDAKVRAVAQKMLRAVAPDVPGIAGPIIDQAVKDGKLTQVQADAFKQRVQALSDRAAQADLGRIGPRGPGHRTGPGPGHRPGPAGPGFSRQDMSVLRDVWQAVRRQAPAVAAPIVDLAVKDGKITQAQGDELKTVAAEAAKDGRPHLFEHRDLLRDENVRAVAGDISRGLARQAPSIGGPIVDQAVKDGKLTQAQGDRAKQRLAEMARRAGG